MKKISIQNKLSRNKATFIPFGTGKIQIFFYLFKKIIDYTKETNNIWSKIANIIFFLNSFKKNSSTTFIRKSKRKFLSFVRDYFVIGNRIYFIYKSKLQGPQKSTKAEKKYLHE